MYRKINKHWWKWNTAILWYFTTHFCHQVGTRKSHVLKKYNARWLSRYLSIFVIWSSLCIEYVKEQKNFTSILCTICLEYLSPMDGYFITEIRPKKVFLKKVNYQCWNFKLLWQTIYDLLRNWRQHQDYHGEGHHSPPLFKSPSKSAGHQSSRSF